MTREQKMQILREKLENLGEFSEILLDVILSILENGGDAK